MTRSIRDDAVHAVLMPRPSQVVGERLTGSISRPTWRVPRTNDPPPAERAAALSLDRHVRVSDGRARDLRQVAGLVTWFPAGSRWFHGGPVADHAGLTSAMPLSGRRHR